MSVVAIVAAAAPAAAQTRTLELYFTHTRETIKVTYMRNGRYDPGGLRDLNRFLRDWRRNESTKMDPELFDLLWEVYRDVGGKGPVYIVSAYRSPATNNMLRRRSRGVAKFSQHMAGKAIDFYIPGVSISRIREAGFKKQVGGVGYYPTSGSPFIHLDTGSVRSWPRMSRSQLVKIFPDGKTLHLPADGKPLSGYTAAQALEKQGQLASLGRSGDGGGGAKLAFWRGGGGNSNRNDNDIDGDIVRQVDRPGTSNAVVTALLSRDDEVDIDEAIERQSRRSRVDGRSARALPVTGPSGRAASASAPAPAPASEDTASSSEEAESRSGLSLPSIGSIPVPSVDLGAVIDRLRGDAPAQAATEQTPAAPAPSGGAAEAGAPSLVQEPAPAAPPLPAVVPAPRPEGPDPVGAAILVAQAEPVAPAVAAAVPLPAAAPRSAASVMAAPPAASAAPSAPAAPIVLAALPPIRPPHEPRTATPPEERTAIAGVGDDAIAPMTAFGYASSAQPRTPPANGVLGATAALLPPRASGRSDRASTSIGTLSGGGDMFAGADGTRHFRAPWSSDPMLLSSSVAVDGSAFALLSHPNKNGALDGRGIALTSELIGQPADLGSHVVGEWLDTDRFGGISIVVFAQPRS